MEDVKQINKVHGNSRRNQNTITQFGSIIDCKGVKGEIKKEKSYKRKRSHSPCRERKVLPLRDSFLPKFCYEMSYGSVLQLKFRYTNLYVPSNFVRMTSSWVDEFPANRPFTIPDDVHRCQFHVFEKEVDRVKFVKNKHYNSHPTDLDYQYSAKVMLLSLPSLEEFYEVCLPKLHSGGRHPTHVIKFLVGLSEQSKPMAIGGAWSPSQDGPNPESDPAVLVKTAIRTCRTLIGLDLSKCTLWNPFFKLEYSRRSMNGVHYTETVVMYVPDVWNCVPTIAEWKTIVTSHKALAEQKIKNFQEPLQNVYTEQQTKIDEKPDSNTLSMWMWSDTDLKNKLESKGLSSLGNRAQMVDRLINFYRSRVESVSNHTTIKSYANGNDNASERLYKAFCVLPDQPSMLVYPHRTVKSGKFNCVVQSLFELLHYPEKSRRIKEHSFEVYLFCELFNEMLMRDFGYNIFKSVILMHAIPSPKDHLSLVVNSIKAQRIDSSNKITGQIFNLQLYLLSYTFFDIPYSGYVQETDLETIFHCVGLELSNDQVKTLMSNILHSNLNKINYSTILNKLHCYIYDGLIIFQDPQSVIMDIFNGKAIQKNTPSRSIHLQLKTDKSTQISEENSKRLKICIDQFKEKISAIKTNLVKIEITENELNGILENMEYMDNRL